MIAELIHQLIEFQSFESCIYGIPPIENHPRLILSQINGKLYIENPVLYENFKKKANVKINIPHDKLTCNSPQFIDALKEVF